ncbi:MAG TPA: multicopper oxidase domain-containing protein [Rubrobacter sp.]|nr:multicopper oxidase domain-containing protein [Rubrobacter sp.]
MRGTWKYTFDNVSKMAVTSLMLVLSLALYSCGGEDTSKEKAKQGGPEVRTYYIAADPVDWDYAPDGVNDISGRPFDHEEDIFVRQGEHRIGKTYRKALYREYTSVSFSEPKERPQDQKYLGTLGPVIRAEVGDTIKVVFRNNVDFPTSMHPHGVFYEKSSEGAPYQDGTSGEENNGDDVVEPGEERTYTWRVPERAGPGPEDPSSIAWMYHSHVEESDDTNTGLMGPIIVTSKGMAEDDGSPKDVDREFVTLFTIYDENNSRYLDYNIEHFARDPKGVDSEDEGFIESNLMHSVNGYVFGNMPMMKMIEGEKVRWYVMGMGTEVDLHTPHWHGNTVTVMGMRTDVVEVSPATMVVADMVPDDPGVWLYHCHVNDHIDAGMLARYSVESK